MVGENVRRIRLSVPLTQEQLAENAGFSQQYISDLERGGRNSSIVTLFELAQALGSTPVQLISPAGSSVDSDPGSSAAGAQGQV